MFLQLINKETLERAEELMQYFKRQKFVLLKVYNFADAGLDIVSLTLFSSSRERVTRFHQDGHFLNNTLRKDVNVWISVAFNFYNF